MAEFKDIMFLTILAIVCVFFVNSMVSTSVHYSGEEYESPMANDSQMFLDKSENLTSLISTSVSASLNSSTNTFSLEGLAYVPTLLTSTFGLLQTMGTLLISITTTAVEFVVGVGVIPEWANVIITISIWLGVLLAIIATLWRWTL